MGRVEVFQHRESFAEVGDDRRFDNLARRLRHQSAHSRELLHLRGRASRSRVRHHVNRIVQSAFGRSLGRRDSVHHHGCNLFRALRPHIDDLVVLLVLGDEPVVVVLLVGVGLIAGIPDEMLLFLGNDHVVLAERYARIAGMLESQRHNLIAEHHRRFLSAVAIDHIDHVRYLALGKQAVHHLEGNAGMARQQVRNQRTPRSRLNDAGDFLALLVAGLPARFDARMQRHGAGIKSVLDFGDINKLHALARGAFALERKIVQPEHNVLAGNNHRRAVGGMEDVVGRHHQNARLELRLER